MESGFVHPPSEAKPIVWWHWLGGNVSKDGVRLDLEWMKRIGLAGFQLFNVDLGTPKVVDAPLSFGSGPWRDTVDFTATLAEKLGLQMGISSAPGWSETGGPWVKPRDGMKKLVWTETRVKGGEAIHRIVPLPSSVAGPFQNIPGPDGGPELYRDVAVLAYRLPADGGAITDSIVTASSGQLDAAALDDGDIATAQNVPFGPDGTAWIGLRYPMLKTVRAITLAMPRRIGFGAAATPRAFLEASTDGKTFETVAPIDLGASQQITTSFPAVTAQLFRVVFRPGADTPLGGAPGIIPLSFGPPAQSYAISELVLWGSTRVNHVEEKTGFAIAGDYYALRTTPAPPDSPVPTSDIVDVTRFMQPNGMLDWTPPAGQWAVLRFGYSLTGHRNGPASPEGTGLEADKLDGSAVGNDLDAYLAQYGAPGQPHPVGHQIKTMVTDSIEAGPQNWTEGFIDAFRQKRGYNPLPYFPALTGLIVGDADTSDRFLWDFRRTIAELLSENHYKRAADLFHARGLTLYGEALEDHRPQLGDDMEMRRWTDVPMGAMWYFPSDGQPKPTYVADDLGAASVAHVYGQNVAGAESFTVLGFPWAMSPRDLKPIADLEMALGINKFVIHESSHEPRLDARPGLAMMPLLGQYFNRNESWAEQAGPWIDYLTRSSFLLQQGRFAADIAYFYGEEAPLTALYGDALVSDVPEGHGFDFVNSDALLNQLSVGGNGELTAPGGMHYAVLMLGGSSRWMTLQTLQRIHAMVVEGATVAGPKPVGSPSLADDDAAFQQIATELWGSSPADQGRQIGKGRIFVSAVAALAATSTTPDWQFAGTARQDSLALLHRHLDQGELWFVSNRRDAAITGELSLRGTGYAPEFWHADTGKVEPSSYRWESGRTIVPLTLDPAGAVFVVFRKPTAIPSRTVLPPQSRVLATLSDSWRLQLPADRCLPGDQPLSALVSWTTLSDSRARYCAGTGVYRRTLDVPPAWLGHGHRLILDLGDVREMAEVTIGGKTAGLVWNPPYRLDITDFVHAGTNRLQINVTNLWANRLIGDAQAGAAPVASTTGPTYGADAPLRRSGMLGPVTLTETD